jgi:hypothetical protein
MERLSAEPRQRRSAHGNREAAPSPEFASFSPIFPVEKQEKWA